MYRKKLDRDFYKIALSTNIFFQSRSNNEEPKIHNLNAKISAISAYNTGSEDKKKVDRKRMPRL